MEDEEGRERRGEREREGAEVRERWRVKRERKSERKL